MLIIYVKHSDADTESELEEAPSEAKESHPLGSKAPLISEEFEASEQSGTRTISSYSSALSDSTAPLVLTSPSPTLPVRKRYQGTSKLIEYTKGESSEPDSEREG
ncbi:hypothetical protein Tco_0176317 [Tanacetum coccineum]